MLLPLQWKIVKYIVEAQQVETAQKGRYMGEPCRCCESLGTSPCWSSTGIQEGLNLYVTCEVVVAAHFHEVGLATLDSMNKRWGLD